MATYKLAYEKILNKQSTFSSRDVECEIGWTGPELVLRPSHDYFDFAKSVARARDESAKKWKRKGRYGCSDSVTTTNLIGVLSEMCIAVIADQTWYAFNGDEFFAESKGKADVGDNIQVRGVAGDRKFLLIHPEDIDDYLFVMCRVNEENGFTFAVGWDLAETVKQTPCEDFWNNGRPCHRQHCSQLQPMSDFPYLRPELKVSTHPASDFWERTRAHWAAALAEHLEEIELAGSSLSRRLTLERLQWLVKFCQDQQDGKFQKEEQYGSSV